MNLITREVKFESWVRGSTTQRGGDSLSQKKGMGWLLFWLLIVTSILFVSAQEMMSLRGAVGYLTEERERLRVEQQELKGKYLDLMEQYADLEERYEEVQDSLELKTITPSRGMTKVRARGSFTVTATTYDNTKESQGKWIDQTATGFNLKGHTLESARCIAVDPSVIPLRSKVHLTFPDPYEHLNGIYTAYDTGGAIKGLRIDVFFGDGDVRGQVRQFGRRKVKVEIVE